MADAEWVQDALDQYESPLVRYAVSILGDIDRARDAVQDTFLRLCRQDPEKLKGHLAQWLFRVCRNRAFDFHRRASRRKSMALEEINQLEDQSLDPPALLERKEQLQLVRDVLGGLTENQREVVRLKFDCGLTYREISKVTGLSASNVGFLIHVAVKKIREGIVAKSAVSRRLRRVK